MNYFKERTIYVKFCYLSTYLFFRFYFLRYIVNLQLLLFDNLICGTYTCFCQLPFSCKKYVYSKSVIIYKCKRTI